uniref:NADH-ubiquinone oxidoreductase chain 2 n=1 Tax=Haedus sp. TaxID=2931292 RepID=A0A8T9ZXP5_9HEMI|nr:NADH dehydrogenase subunit 2 [Haedus sp.]
MPMFNKKLFMSIMFLSTLLVLSSTSWLITWIGLEINMMSTIPVIFLKKKSNTQKAMIYFLTQAMASMILLGSILNMTFDEYTAQILITITMMIKLGVPPFHMWMPEMMNKLNWNIFMILATVQKISPLFIVSNLSVKNLILPEIMLWGAVLGAIMGVNQISLNKILAYSSINHMSWMLLCMMSKNNMWMIYFIVYSFLMLSLCFMMKQLEIFYINQFSMNFNWTSKMMIMVMMMNMSGLPPLPGFFIKWMALEASMNNSLSMLILLIMIMTSLITLLFYIKMTIYMTTTSSTNIKFKNISENISMSLIFISNMTMPVLILI